MANTEWNKRINRCINWQKTKGCYSRGRIGKVITKQGVDNVTILALVEKIREISSISNSDYSEIVSTFITLTQPKYRCSDCKHKYKSKFKEHQMHMACNYYADKPRHRYNPDFNNKGNPRVMYKNCIGNHYNGYWASIINYYQDYSKGILPFTGGLLEQPSKFVEIMNLVHNLIRENELEQERKASISRNNKIGKR